MELKVHKIGKKTSGKVKVTESIFAAKYNEPLIHQVVTAFMAGARQGSKAQKRRSDVRGGGKKPWRQKGLGRARAGTIRSPLWRGGGVTFAARPRKFLQKVNRKMYRGAMRSILSELVRQERLIVVEKFSIDKPKTKSLVETLQSMKLEEVLIITDEVADDLLLASRNVPTVGILEPREINPFTLVGFENVMVTKSALEKIEALLT